MKQQDTMGYSNTREMPQDLNRLETMGDWEVAIAEADPRGYEVIGRDNQSIGTIRDLIASPSAGKAYLAIVETGNWLSNKRYAIPLSILGVNMIERKAYGPFTRAQFEKAPEYQDDSRNYTSFTDYWRGIGGTAPAVPTEAAGTMAGAKAAREGEVRVAVSEETAKILKQEREAGHVTLRKRADVETQHITEPVTHTRVVVERHPAGATTAGVTGADATALREGEEIRVPVVEEELVVQKVPRVVEEVVVRTEQETKQVERDVELRREHVEVEEEGDIDVDLPADATRRR